VLSTIAIFCALAGSQKQAKKQGEKYKMQFFGHIFLNFRRKVTNKFYICGIKPPKLLQLWQILSKNLKNSQCAET